MGYVGNQTTTAFTSMAKQDITGNGGTGYTLDHAVANAQEIEVFVNNVRQEPAVAYTVSGTTLTMTGNVAASDDFYVVFQGKALQTTVPPDDSVTTARINDDAVTSDKLAHDINIVTSLGVNTIKENTGTTTALSIDSSGYITRSKNCAFLAHTPTAASATADTILKWTTEVFDTDSCFDHTTGLFTAPVNGIYFFSFHSLIKDNNYMVSDFAHSGMSNDVRMQSRAVSANGGINGAGHVFQMNANETMGIFNSGATYSEAYQDDYCAFSGYLISAT